MQPKLCERLILNIKDITNSNAGGKQIKTNKVKLGLYKTPNESRHLVNYMIKSLWTRASTEYSCALLIWGSFSWFKLSKINFNATAFNYIFAQLCYIQSSFLSLERATDITLVNLIRVFKL